MVFQNYRTLGSNYFFLLSRKVGKTQREVTSPLRLCVFTRLFFFLQRTEAFYYSRKEEKALREVSQPLRLLYFEKVFFLALGEGPLISIILRLKRPLHLHADVLRLVLRKGIELYAQLGQVQEGYLLVQVLWKYIYSWSITLIVSP